MKLTHLLESVDTEMESVMAAAMTVARDCTDFLIEIDWGEHIMYRGMSGADPSELIINKRVRKDRQSSATATRISNVVDNTLEAEFGFKPRSAALFATGDFNAAASYGERYMVFPIGEYQFIWSDVINDMYVDLFDGSVSDSVSDALADALSENDIEYDDIGETWAQLNSDDRIKVIKTLFSQPTLYTSMNLVDGIKSGNEIMISCDNYYAVNTRVLHKVGITPRDFMQMVLE